MVFTGLIGTTHPMRITQSISWDILLIVRWFLRLENFLQRVLASASMSGGCS